MTDGNRRRRKANLIFVSYRFPLVDPACIGEKKYARANESSQSIASCGNAWPKCLLSKSLKEVAQCSVIQMNVDAW
jgi:hypothetical protein